MNKIMIVIASCLLLAACGTQPVTPSSGHLRDEPRPAGNIPQPVQQAAPLPPPKATPKAETYSVTVNNVAVQELLFALARDAKVNIDIHPGIEGAVTLNALNQTLPQLLTRIARQVDMRYELDGPNLVVMQDTPFLRNYKVDYLNMARDATSNISIATQIGTTGSGAGATGGASGNNNSTTSVTNTSNNRFWETLVQNIKDILRETDKVLPDSSAASTTEQPANSSPTAPTKPSANQADSQAGNTATTPRSTFREAASVIANPENGLLGVRATSRQQEKVQEFIDQIMASAKRQVMIEATVVEVRLSDQYQQGINWSQLHTNPTRGFNLSQRAVGTLPSGINPGVSQGLLTIGYIDQTSPLGNIAASIQLLESFGNVKVLSSPKISVLNNQTALLKVVDNKVYFTIEVTITPATATSAQLIVYTTTVNTVPVGFVMSVTPQIDDTDTVTMNVRPTISRITGYVNDPSPPLKDAGVVSPIPEIQTREMESILKVSSGQVAIMGGLMQDSVDNSKDAIPLLSRLPFVGDAFSYRNEASTKSELVIFLRPIVVKNASLDGDYRAYRNFLPDKKFLHDPLDTTTRHLFEPVETETAKP
ncbi:MAG: pilus (MSHA type) biogenesis protein MshL [Deltaproteobacteria bacterium RIFOXYD12_FULL_55_16]|nr:MAG: pilus (MSHA type) biogenesis protein MshL [Deltaproteobacteria bacterium RIFOXYD12_FULL_55_16]